MSFLVAGTNPFHIRTPSKNDALQVEKIKINNFKACGGPEVSLSLGQNVKLDIYRDVKFISWLNSERYVRRSGFEGELHFRRCNDFGSWRCFVRIRACE